MIILVKPDIVLMISGGCHIDRVRNDRLHVAHVAVAVSAVIGDKIVSEIADVDYLGGGRQARLGTFLG